jgi:phosphatidylserine/phosphatidylglycerophosphate/cardiolipin synthase-like enzyme
VVKKMVLYVVVALLLGGFVGYYLAPIGVFQGRISTLENYATALQRQVDVLQEQVNAKDARIADLMQTANLTVLGVYFSPQGGCEGQVVHWIDRANETLHVLIYSFTNDVIGDAVVRAQQRGVEVKVVFEESQISNYSEYWKLQSIGALVRNDTNSGLMHHKTAVIDGYVILTGSFNWSAAAEERNNENMMILRSEDLARVFEDAFQTIWAIAV